MTPRCRQMSTVGRLTPSRSATSAMPTGSQSLMADTVEKVLTVGKKCVDNHYMTKPHFRIRKVTISPHEHGCLIGMDETGQLHEWPTPEAAVAAIRRRDSKAARLGESTATLIEWQGMPEGFEPPEVAS